VKAAEIISLDQKANSKAGLEDGISRDLLSALSGTEAGREREVAYKTRRVVQTSLGVMQDQKAGRKRGLGLAVAAILVFCFVLGPFFWRVADEFFGGDFIGDNAAQFSMWACILCPALLAAALVVGWMRNKS
jgi:hypothetical protein